MIFKLLEKKQIQEFKQLMIEAFQYGYESYTKKKEEQVLPECDIDKSLNNKNAYAYVMVEGEKILGGLIVNIDNEEKMGFLDFIFVRVDCESKGIGQKMWKEIEQRYPNIIKWQTCTPYFDRRNIHFYVNKLKFKIVEYYNRYHKDPNEPSVNDDEFFEDDGGMFEFEKIIK